MKHKDINDFDFSGKIMRKKLRRCCSFQISRDTALFSKRIFLRKPFLNRKNAI